MAKGRIREKQIEEAEAGRQPQSDVETYRRERNAPFEDAEAKAASDKDAKLKLWESQERERRRLENERRKKEYGK